MSLYNTYRPRDWDSVIGQDYITTILRNSIKTGRVHHAYLFHGSRGTGKTTSARILAKAINCLNPHEGNPCHECTNCKAFDNETMLDIIEIDGASNNSVENVRDLIEKARFEPNQGTYKIYIIDEVHMLSTGAFNALLKTLEQPPKHVKFILATTEIDKVLATVRSRTLRFDFRKISIDDLIGRMKYVCEAEKIDFDEEALRIIAKAARGGFRDALTLLEQNRVDDEVRTEHVRYTLALVEESLIDACMDALRDSDVLRIQEILKTLKEKHIEARGFFDQMLYKARDMMIDNINSPLFYTYSQILEMFESAYGRIRSIPDGMMLIEITLFRIVKRGGGEVQVQEEKTKQSPSPKVEKIQKSEPPQEVLTSKKEGTKDIQAAPPRGEKDTTIENTAPTITPSDQPTVQVFSYPSLINHLKTHHLALTTDLKMARFQREGNTLSLIFSKKWNYERVNTPKTKNIITEAIQELYGENWDVKCSFSESSSSISHAADEVF